MADIKYGSDVELWIRINDDNSMANERAKRAPSPYNPKTSKRALMPKNHPETSRHGQSDP